MLKTVEFSRTAIVLRHGKKENRREMYIGELCIFGMHAQFKKRKNS